VSIRVEAGQGYSSRVGETNGIQVLELEVGGGAGILDSGGIVWLESDLELVDSWLEVQGAFGVPATIRKAPKNAGIDSLLVHGPGLGVDDGTATNATGSVSKLVARVGCSQTIPNKLLVNEGIRVAGRGVDRCVSSGRWRGQGKACEKSVEEESFGRHVDWALI
jgi:hypothetical protein